MTIGNAMPFGLRDVKVVNSTGTAYATLPAAKTMTVTPRMAGGELTGSDRIASVVAYPIGADLTLEGGGIPFNALAIITGKTATLEGVSPGQTLTLAVEAGDVMPYFKAYGRAVGEGQDDVHCKVFKCKANKLEGSFAENTFIITKCSGVALPDDSGKIYEWVQNETAADLPTT